MNVLFSLCKAEVLTLLCTHHPCRTMGSRQALNLDYLPFLRLALLAPLQRLGAEGAGQAVKLLDDYQLVKDDVDSIMEVSVWGGRPDPFSKLDSKVSILY